MTNGSLYPLPARSSLQNRQSFSLLDNDYSKVLSLPLYDIFEEKLPYFHENIHNNDEPFPFDLLVSTNIVTPPAPVRFDNSRKRERSYGTDTDPILAAVCSSFTDYASSAPNPKKKKPSTAQPRPRVAIPAYGIGPIACPTQNDVLSGRGGRINAHAGNVQFRQILVGKKKTYLGKETKKLAKAFIAFDVVEQIRHLNPPGRFLKQDHNGLWWDIGDIRAIKKVGQALREYPSDPRAEQNDDFELYSA